MTIKSALCSFEFDQMEKLEFAYVRAIEGADFVFFCCRLFNQEFNTARKLGHGSSVLGSIVQMLLW